MANPEHVEILKQGVEVWNAWREKHPDIQPNLSGWRATPREIFDSIHHPENKKQVYLPGVDFMGANLDGARLEGAILRVARLDDVDASKTNFDNADMYRVSFRRANLQEASFRDAMIWGAYFDGADLAEANLERASIGSSELLWSQPPCASFVKANHDPMSSGSRHMGDRQSQ